MRRGPALAWQNPQGVTPDEFFFITKLYGNMTSECQRTMIRGFFGPLFVRAARRDIRNFREDLVDHDGLRSPLMKDRLYMMGAILRSRGIAMQT